LTPVDPAHSYWPAADNAIWLTKTIPFKTVAVPPPNPDGDAVAGFKGRDGDTAYSPVLLMDLYLPKKPYNSTSSHGQAPYDSQYGKPGKPGLAASGSGKPDGLAPVLIHFFGGAFVLGIRSFTPAYFGAHVARGYAGMYCLP
jgi:hypothetical protein